MSLSQTCSPKGREMALMAPESTPGADHAGYVPVGAEEGAEAPGSEATRGRCCRKVAVATVVATLMVGAVALLSASVIGPAVTAGNEPAMRGSRHNMIVVDPTVEVKGEHAKAVKDADEDSKIRKHRDRKNHHHHHTTTTTTTSSRPKPDCDTDNWPDKAHGLVCGDCRVLVNKFNTIYETCDNYCNLQGRQCIGAWEEEDENCDIKHKIKCDEVQFSSDAICECGKKVNATLMREFEEKVVMKRQSMCGAMEDDVDFWTDGSLFSAGGIESAEKCQEMCRGNPGCGAWTWGKQENVPGLTHVCYLKTVRWGAPITMHLKTGLVSGRPYGPDCDDFKPDYYTRPRVPRQTQEPEPRRRSKAWANLTLTNHSVIRSKHGFCLDATGHVGNGSLVQMMTCKPGKESQQWVLTPKTGMLMNQLGFCLATDGPQDLSSLHTLPCDEKDWNQKWDYFGDKARIANWRGPCLDAAEPRDGGALYTRVCDEDNLNQWLRLGPVENVTLHAARAAHVTLYCFALMLPGSYEQGLLAFQYKSRVSLFGCDAYSVYSNRAIKVAKGLVSGIVDSDLKCKKGGEFGTALNLPIFLAVWKKVVDDATFMEHDWTVKVDPDAVFFPERLRGIVSTHAETKNGVYLNNCKYGLHGPLEVFSRNAVVTWSGGSKQCMDHFWKLCNGDCMWGEDLFIDQCLFKVLDVGRQNDYRLLVEDHCDPPDEWEQCRDFTSVAFHPFKNVTGYRGCLENATGGLRARK